jgi:hypothetical protein
MEKRMEKLRDKAQGDKELLEKINELEEMRRKKITDQGKETQKQTDSLKGQFAEAATLTSKAGFRTGIRRAGERQLASIKTNTGKSARYLKNIQDKQAKTYSMN